MRAGPKPQRLTAAIFAGTLLLAAPLPVLAQVVAGVVRDTEGRPLPQAQVVALPGARTAVTDAAGRFRLGRLADGEYRLEVSLIGYAPVTHIVRVAAAGGAIEPLTGSRAFVHTAR